MPYSVRGLESYYKQHQEYPKDKEFRKKLIREWYITRVVDSIEKCIADKNRILEDIYIKPYRKRRYDTRYVLLEHIRDDPYHDKYGWLDEAGLEETIYYNKTIKDIYYLQRIDYIKGNEREFIFFLEATYPAKMPKQDYFAFADFDYGTKIEFTITKKEIKLQPWILEIEEYKNGKPYVLTIDDYYWCFCILLIDDKRMFISLDWHIYYFKQVGKNVHFFKFNLLT